MQHIMVLHTHWVLPSTSSLRTMAVLPLIPLKILTGARNDLGITEQIRRMAFWALDFLTGSKVRKNYADIQYTLENSQDPGVIKKQAEALSGILEYATKNVDFYKGLSAQNDLGAFPVINKNIIRNNYEAFQSPQFAGSKGVPMQTSGSTGTPFVVRQDKTKRDRVYAEMMYLWGKAGYQIGMRYVFLRIRNPFSQLTAWARNVKVLPIGKQDEEVFEGIRALLKSDPRIRMILGYPSVLKKLAGYMLEKGDTPDMFGIHTVIGFGESFLENSLQKLKEVFNCNIISLYSNQENGMLAEECIENKEFHINSASYYIELLQRETDAPAAIGEPGRIVVTDLFNKAMPMIRYDTGDIGVWKEKAECGWHTQVLASVDGQKTDVIFDTKGNEKSPHNVSVVMAPFDRLLQYQFIQEGATKYTLKLNGAGKYYPDQAFVDLFKGLLGQDAEITVEHVVEIPVLASGKRKEVLNLYKNVKARPEIVG